MIEFIDLIRILFIIITKNKININKLNLFINLLFPSLNGKRLIKINLINSSKNLCKFIESYENFSSDLKFNENNSLLHKFIYLIHILLLFYLVLFIDTNIFKDLLIKLKTKLFIENNDNDTIYSNNPIVLIDINKTKFHLNNINLTIQQGECFSLLGFNGAGKSNINLFCILVFFGFK